jgi:hypothetical protein
MKRESETGRKSQPCQSRFLEMMFTQFRQFTIALTARYRGDCHGRNKEEVRYANEYLGLFQFRDGLITSWREYDNPLVSSAATAGLLGTSL